MITQSAYFGMFVNDLESAIRFYQGQLGFHIDEEASIPGHYAQFNLSKDISLALFHTDTATANWPQYEFGLIVDNVDATYTDWKERGVGLEETPQDMPFGRTFALVMAEGYALRIIQLPLSSGSL